MTAFQYTSKAIPCSYNGLNFRSLLEGRIAYFFDKMGFDWQYEPFELDGYIPDFLLLEEGMPIIVDVKPFFDDGYRKEVLSLLGQQMKGKGFCAFDVAFMKGVEKFSLSPEIKSLFARQIGKEDADYSFEEVAKRTGSLASYGISHAYGFYDTQLNPLPHPFYFLPKKDAICIDVEPNCLYAVSDILWTAILSVNSKKQIVKSINGTIELNGHDQLSLETFFEASKYVQEIWIEAQNHFQYKGKTPQLVVTDNSLAA